MGVCGKFGIITKQGPSGGLALSLGRLLVLPGAQSLGGSQYTVYAQTESVLELVGIYCLRQGWCLVKILVSRHEKTLPWQYLSIEILGNTKNCLVPSICLLLFMVLAVK